MCIDRLMIHAFSKDLCMNYKINNYVYNCFSYIANNYKSQYKNDGNEIENLIPKKNQEPMTEENKLTDVNDSLINTAVKKVDEQIQLEKKTDCSNESNLSVETHNNFESKNNHATERIIINVQVCVVFKLV